MTKKYGKWQVLEETLYEKFKIFSIKKSKRVNPRTSSTFDFFLIDALDWVNVIAITEQDELVLVEQYRHGSEEWLLEFPGGVVEADEPDPTLSGARELREETGYEAAEVSLIGSIRPNPAMLSNKLHVCIARNVRLSGSQLLDSGEDIRVVLKPLSELKNLIASGELRHAHVIAAVALAEAKGIRLIP